MEETENALPEVFYTLLEQKEKADRLTPEILLQYYAITVNEPTFIPEFMDFLGPERLVAFIHQYGGVTLNIPTASDILNTVRKNAHDE